MVVELLFIAELPVIAGLNSAVYHSLSVICVGGDKCIVHIAAGAKPKPQQLKM